MKNPKIIGIVQCRNEWGLIAVSISYALANHVDEVYVLNDFSSDKTHQGFIHLQKLWHGRLHVINTGDVGFHQEVMTNMLVHLSKESNPDWVYVFDADEFMLVSENTSLKKILSKLDSDVYAIEYPVENYISVEDFDENKLECYKKLRYKSIPSKKMEHATTSENIYSGRSNYFDFQFGKKVIFRYLPSTRIKAGAHSIIDFSESGITVKESRIRAAHFPLLTKKRLENKAMQGEAHVKLGRAPTHGWQNQMVYRLKQNNKLDCYWRRHSISKDTPTGDGGPSYIEDDSFIRSIEGTLDYLQKGFESPVLTCNGDKKIHDSTAQETALPMCKVIELMRIQQMQTDFSRVNKKQRRKPLAKIKRTIEKFRQRLKSNLSSV